jgi:hypothetical protein
MTTKTKTISVLGTLGLVAVLCLAVGSVAFAGDQDFTLNNKTGFEIHKLFVSPHSSDEWGEDILGRDTLDDGESVNIKFGNREKAAHWDLKIVEKSGTTYTWENLNLMEIAEVSLFFKDGKTYAEFK